MSDELNFKGKDPGAVKHGNFINYYQFNSVENRLHLLPKNLWNLETDQSFACLDIGCNSGNLTQELYKFVSMNLSVIPSAGITGRKKGDTDCHILGIDLDPVLIARAVEENKFSSNVTYKCVNYMSDSENTVSLYLMQHNKNDFDCIFCFSVTMWIHLNYGDEGLKQFLISLSMQTNLVVIEPQPWKCYRSAMRRMKRSGGNFPEFTNLKMREPATDIENIFLTECNFTRLEVGNPCTSWGRELLFFKKVS